MCLMLLIADYHCVYGNLRGRLKRSARTVQLFGRLAVLETHALRY